MNRAVEYMDGLRGCLCLWGWYRWAWHASRFIFMKLGRITRATSPLSVSEGPRAGFAKRSAEGSNAARSSQYSGKLSAYNLVIIIRMSNFLRSYVMLDIAPI